MNGCGILDGKYIGKNILCFDTETTGLPITNKQYFGKKNFYYSPNENDKYDKSRIIQIVWTFDD